MRRYIDADKIEYEDMLRPRGDGNYEECQIAYRDQIDDIPTADVRENVRGEWQPIEVQPYFKKHFNTSVACSVCHRKGDKRWNFCPNCGAQMMRRKQDERIN